MATQRDPGGEPLTVEILEVAPNPAFTDEQRAWVRFLRYSRKVPCAECGKRRRILWTMLCEFRAPTLRPGDFVVRADEGAVHPPLAGVCQDHPLAIAWPEKEPAKKGA